MRFNSEAYDKLFPRQKDPDPAVETPVETFRPSQNSGKAEKPVEDPDPVPEDPAAPEEEEMNHDDGSTGESDPEQ